jgi:hypothetical protein
LEKFFEIDEHSLEKIREKALATPERLKEKKER